MSEIRYDLLHNEYIIIAPERLHRPIPEQCVQNFSVQKCPFCPGNEELTPQEIFSIKNNGTWQTRVIPNLYKAVQIETPFISHREGLNEMWGGYGAHEIVIDTPKHLANFQNMRQEEIFWWLYTLQQRYLDLRNDKRLISLQIFKNHGLRAGATQPHPHTQIIALPLMTKEQLFLFQHCQHYYHDHGRSMHEDIVHFESNSQRNLFESEHFFSYVPYASSFAFETAIIAKDVGFDKCTQMQLQELAKHLQKLFQALANELGDFPYNLLFYLPPLNENFENSSFFHEIDAIFRFYIRITPRIYTIAGFELATGSMINPVVPETVAKLLRRWYETSS
ncbi:galactose-1-phosphate uridylyltransferase [Nitratiruptor sp. YY09-18]|uniref:galactose-1-phosphate uridylyltransferase n=1 Tax=Nitratiruptor sp. YY09-18 TaxID=2724901 RepID=UPI0019163F9F|nr:galactose-1-phosphate uridylyltransferase [Nitratiruptor sp. YY09-18]BCD68137.1 UDPglucose--hexose-1-phosphate uridylyltransferase [Nitratiruptor sp. YY09-18]